MKVLGPHHQALTRCGYPPSLAHGALCMLKTLLDFGASRKEVLGFTCQSCITSLLKQFWFWAAENLLILSWIYANATLLT